MCSSAKNMTGNKTGNKITNANAKYNAEQGKTQEANENTAFFLDLSSKSHDFARINKQNLHDLLTKHRWRCSQPSRQDCRKSTKIQLNITSIGIGRSSDLNFALFLSDTRWRWPILENIYLLPLRPLLR